MTAIPRGLTILTKVAKFDQMATISRIWAPGVGTISIGIFALDHCDPHVSCRDQNRTWTARFDFSFVHDVVTLKDIIPPNARIPGHALHHVKAEVLAKLVDCRKVWWNFQGSNPVSQTAGACCLNNNKINGQTVIPATFDPVNCKTFVALADGTVYEWPP